MSRLLPERGVAPRCSHADRRGSASSLDAWVLGAPATRFCPRCACSGLLVPGRSGCEQSAGRSCASPAGGPPRGAPALGGLDYDRCREGGGRDVGDGGRRRNPGGQAGARGRATPRERLHPACPRGRTVPCVPEGVQVAGSVPGRPRARARAERAEPPAPQARAAQPGGERALLATRSHRGPGGARARRARRGARLAADAEPGARRREADLAARHRDRGRRRERGPRPDRVHGVRLMKAWRLSRFDSQQRTFDGEGARLFPGRWNPTGVPVVYSSEHLSLAVLEVLVHARVDQVRIAFHALVEVVPDEQLPRGWDGAAIARATRELGETWARERRSVALAVPSVIVRQERNVVLNPLHSEFARLPVARPVRFRFYQRLLRVSGRPPT